MKFKDKKVIFILSGAAVIILLVAVFYFASVSADEKTPRTPVYYYNPASMKLETEQRSVTDGFGGTMLDAAVHFFFESPRGASLQRVSPEKDGFLEAYVLHGNVLEVSFTDEYFEMQPLDEALFRAAFIWTVTELPYVDNVVFTVGGNNILTERTGEYEYYNRENVVINPEISWVRIITRTFRLYFIDREGEGLVEVEHTVENVDMDQVERSIVQQLIDGLAGEEFYSAIPFETRILEIRTEEGTCFVNLSGDFNARFNGSPELARLMIYSIVNSLIENIRAVRRVRFTIDYDMVEHFHGLTEFNQFFEKDETLVVAEYNIEDEAAEAESAPED